MADADKNYDYKCESEEERKKRLHLKALDVPFVPGVYIMHDKSGKIIYVGKSKTLHNRLSQYFSPAAKNNIKTEHMVRAVLNILLPIRKLKLWLLKTNLSRYIHQSIIFVLRTAKVTPI